MNVSQLLEVATKVFINQEETKWEANKKMKKMDLLAAVLGGQSGVH
jgi:hypothetical protein